MTLGIDDGDSVGAGGSGSTSDGGGGGRGSGPAAALLKRDQVFIHELQRVKLKSQGNIYTFKPLGSHHLLIGLLQQKVMALNVSNPKASSSINITNKPFELNAISNGLPPASEIISLEVFELDGLFVIGKNWVKPFCKFTHQE